MIEKMAYITEMIRPWWITNWLSTADRLYERRPCQRIKVRRYLNLSIEKSAASEACFPSFSTMPTPMWASYIPTSLPPSPTLQVRLPVNYAIFRVIKDFWVGLHRQTQTLGAFVAASQNFSSRLGLVSIRSRVYPSIIRSASCFLSNSESSCSA